MLKIVTFNLRSAWIGDGPNSLPHRLGAILDKIDVEQPDMVCFQEVDKRAAVFFEKHMPEYMVIYNGQEENYNGEGLMTILRRETMELLSTEFFWLSPTPYIPASKFEGQGAPRIAQAMLVRRRGATKPFWVYNTRLDNENAEVHLLCAKQLMERICADQEKCHTAIYLLGNFDMLLTNEAVLCFKRHPEHPLFDASRDVGGTYHAFGAKKENPNQVDHIFIDNPTYGKHSYALGKWTDEQDGIYLSDHYPVYLTIDD